MRVTCLHVCGCAHVDAASLCNRYSVLPKKPKSIIEDMAELISQKFCGKDSITRNKVQCGIVYCMSRNDCERVAGELEHALRQRGKMLRCK